MSITIETAPEWDWTAAGIGTGGNGHESLLLVVLDGEHYQGEYVYDGYNRAGDDLTAEAVALLEPAVVGWRAGCECGW